MTHGVDSQPKRTGFDPLNISSLPAPWWHVSEFTSVALATVNTIAPFPLFVHSRSSKQLTFVSWLLRPCLHWPVDPPHMLSQDESSRRQQRAVATLPRAGESELPVGYCIPLKHPPPLPPLPLCVFLFCGGWFKPQPSCAHRVMKGKGQRWLEDEDEKSERERELICIHLLAL